MKKYVEKIDRWKNIKVLEYLNNFLKNHNGIINDSTLFDPITDMMRECDWKKKIHETEAGFTELTKKMCASLGREEIGKLSDTLDKLTNALITTEPTSYQAQLLAHFK